MKDMLLYKSLIYLITVKNNCELVVKGIVDTWNNCREKKANEMEIIFGCIITWNGYGFY